MSQHVDVKCDFLRLNQLIITIVMSSISTIKNNYSLIS